MRGTRRTNHTIDHYQNFTVVDQPAPNKANYHKITGAPYPGEFAYRPNFTQINAHNETKVVKQPTHIKDGKSGDAWEAAQPGDILEVTGQTEDNSYYFARNKRFPNGKRGTIAQEKTVDRNGGLDTPGVPLTNAANAATTDSSVPLYKPLSDDRQKSVGTDGEFGRFHRSGIDLEVDLTAAGLDTAGKKKLVVAQSVRQPDKKGYIEKDKVRIITDTTAALTQEYQSQPGNQGAQLERITTDFVVTGKTILRQPQEDSNGVITFKDSYELEPGEILQHTAESRAVFKQDKMWATEMKWQGKYMGMINMEKAQALPDDQKAILKLNTPVDGVRDKATLQKVLVTDKTTLRAIKGNRIHSFAIGSKTVALKPDTAVYVDFSIKGVDETFNYAWVFAQTDEDAFGYIREEKITNPHTEGKVRETTWGGKQIEGNEIPLATNTSIKLIAKLAREGIVLCPYPIKRWPPTPIISIYATAATEKFAVSRKKTSF
ncbi:MAG: hypothetical protein M5U34_04770 [Chloroflexi bacterium]|nr:hypothetical protein [Chloroflexota bacterium]